MEEDGSDTNAFARTEIDPNPETAEYDLLEFIADTDGTPIEALPPLYTQIDHLVENLFKNPPAPNAQVEVVFSYAGYRVRITQEGTVRLVPVKESLDLGR